MAEQINFGDRAFQFWRSRSKLRTPLWDSHTALNERLLTRYIHSEDAVLDLGCAEGKLTRRIARIAKRVVAVDFVPAFKNPPSNVELVTADVRGWETRESFDVIVVFGFSQFIESDVDLLAVYQMCRRHLRTGGCLIVKHQSATGDADKPVDHHSDALGAHYVSLYRTVGHDTDLLHDAGFSVSTISPYPPNMNRWPDTAYKAYLCRKRPRVVLSGLTVDQRTAMPHLWRETIQNTQRASGLDIAASMSMLRSVCTRLEEAGAMPLIGFGTLLGIVRDKALISYDTDADVLLRERDVDLICPALALCGYPFVRAVDYGRNQGEMLISVGSSTAYLDIYVYREEYGGEYVYFYGQSRFDVDRDDWDRPGRLRFGGYNYAVPRRPERYLRRWYGNWQEPVNYYRGARKSTTSA